ncbi:hypothetical protein [Coriobacterium glomerans]|uniref:hypothetical protein n=1 Tax=Coriobacterium glomerans TaxID=33871 RepID=UPI0012EA3CC1|nr:hypothetical protein [Coriobacterium glomerans]
MSAAVAGVSVVLFLRNEFKSGKARASRYRFTADLLFIALLPVLFIAMLALPRVARDLIYYGLGFGSIYVIRRYV